jgi:catechol 2,3-dioxygenase-like lactoylglutathione lyase family enzyme
MMKFRMSPNIAVRTRDFQEAIEFYTKVIGFNDRSADPELADLNAKPINLFIIEDQEFRGPVLELFVDDLEVARDELVGNGCKVIRWIGKGQDCYVEDPFGVRYNLWEEKED